MNETALKRHIIQLARTQEALRWANAFGRVLARACWAASSVWERQAARLPCRRVH